MIQMGESAVPGGWRRTVVRASALEGAGVDETVDALREHLSWLASSGTLRQRRTARARDEITALVVSALRERLGDLGSGGALDTLAGRVVDGATDPFAAAHELRGALGL